MSADTWVTKTSMLLPTGRSYTCAVGTDIFSVGGASPPGGGTVENRVYKYDTLTDSWLQRANMPQQASALVLGSDGTYLYAVGGSLFGITYNSCLRYDPVGNSWSTMATMPAALHDAQGCALAGKIYVAGGATGGFGTDVATLYVYDPGSNTWATKASMPSAGSGGGACAYGGYLWVGTSNHFFRYDPVANTWATRAGPGSSFASGSLATGPSGVYGYFTPGNLWSFYDTVAATWTTKTSPVTSRTNGMGPNLPFLTPYIWAIGGASGGPNERYEAQVISSMRWRTGAVVIC